MTAQTKEPILINTHKWIEQNQDQFKPPVCNKLMHNDQLTVMFVGGSNQREDYHIEEGEELFYQIKGQMTVKIIENGQHKDIVINEGEVFLLPARVPHSPQRPRDTIGLVIERKRPENEIDGVRWFVPNTDQPLYEKWFHCTDLGVQLAPVIKEYFASEEYITKKPGNHVLQSYPFQLNKVLIDKEKHGAFDLLKRIKTELKTKNCFLLTPSELNMQFVVEVLGTGEHNTCDFASRNVDMWIWQLNGESKVSSLDKQKEYNLTKYDSLLIPSGYCQNIKINVNDGGYLLKVIQDPRLK